MLFRSVALSRTLEAARKSSTRPPTVPSEKEHAARMNELDSTRISLAKAIRDAEGALATKEAELAVLKEEVRSLKEYDPVQEHEGELDGTAYASP